MRRKGLTIIALCIALSISGCAKGSNKEDSINKKTEETKESGEKASNGTQDKENPYEGIKLKADEDVVYKFSNVSVHDPSVVRADGNYYIFGSHLTAAKSANLIDWTLIDTGVTATNSIIPDAKKEMPEAFVWAKTDTFWAPDVIQLADGRYYMYYCTCEGSMPLSTLGIAVADNIEGPYEDLGIILKSGMGEDIPSEDGDVYNAGVQPNVVDPCVYYDT